MHPVIESHLGQAGGDAAGYDVPDSPAGALPSVTFGNTDRTPHTVAMMAFAALLGLAILRLSGFRFVVGGAAGIIR